MAEHFDSQTILVVGAAGGLGSAIAAALAARGARLILAGRRLDALSALAARLGPRARPAYADVSDLDSLLALRDVAGPIDGLINASGVDARKPFDRHEPAEIRRLLDVNLLGAIQLSQVFLPGMRERRAGFLVHLGGFADGRLALPYYSVDAASRAGLVSFVEALNRELAIEGSPVRVSVFSPAPADTAAERPFHPLWRDLGLTIATPERVADELLSAIERGERLHVMGGAAAALFARLNAAWPGLADRLLLDGYGRKLKRFLAPSPGLEPAAPKRRLLPALGVTLLVLSFVFYGLLLALPFAPLSGPARLGAAPALVGLGEASFWIGGLMLGPTLLARIRRYLNPRWWLCLEKA